MGALKRWGNPSFYRTDGCLLLPCTGLTGGQEDTSLPVRGAVTWRFICLFLSPPLQPTAWLTSWITQAIIKASGKGDHSCFLLVKPRLVSWGLKCFSLIETVGFNIWVSLLAAEAWGEQRSHWVILWHSSSCPGAREAEAAFALVKGRWRGNRPWRALNGKTGRVFDRTKIKPVES